MKEKDLENGWGSGGGLEVHLHENMKEKVPEDVVVGGGVLGFIYMKTKGKVPDNVILQEGWFFISSSTVADDGVNCVGFLAVILFSFLRLASER